ncbi:MAG TPA: FG-GAP-like repeat-containing protein [Xanthobacteraceae bacterium]|nr:FG-GAP-like repeat-containing protein [Xanthobacteraceae bacterium]
MKPIVTIAVLGIGVAVVLNFSAAAAQTSTPFFSATYQGFNYVSYYNGAYENADSLPALVATGANAAALTLDYGIDVNNSTVYADSNYTDSLTALGDTIAEAKGRGLSVMVRPLIDFLDPSKIGSYSVGEWRSLYNPGNPAAFFASYKTMIVGVAQVAQANGADTLSVGAELDQLTGPAYSSYWIDIVSSVRAVFSGKLTYSSDWDDDISPWQGENGLTAGTGSLATQVSFWSELDYLGIDCYAPLSDAAHPVLADLMTGWTQTPSDPTSLTVTGSQSLIGYFETVVTQTGLPLIFTELGYESASDAAQQPSGTSTQVYDPALQAILYTAFFDAWQQSANHPLAGVYFWNWDPNAAEVGPGNGPNFSPQSEPAQRVVTAAFAGRPVNTLPSTHDFNGDGYSDILWRDNSGNLAIWEMNGGTILNPSNSGLGSVPTTWSIVGQRDFNGDGNADILWRDNSGNLAIWEMNGTTILNPNSSGLGNVPTNWSVVGVGDFNGDGMADILWRNNNNGNVAIWEMNGTTILNANTATFGNMPLTWSVAGTGDFNGDGYSDILWLDGSGDIAIWEMNGTTILNPNTSGVGNLSTVWTIAETGDFDGNGESDILWRDTGGDIAIWFMNGTTIASGAGLGTISTAFAIQGSNAD